MAVIRFTSESNTGTQAVNVWHFRVSTASTSLANEAITAVDTFFEAMKAFMAPATWTHGLRVTTLGPPPNIVVPATPLTTVTTGATTAPMQVAGGITWTTAFIGKSFRGRSYIGPLALASLGSDGLGTTGPFNTALLAAGTALRAPTAGGAQLTVWSQKLGTDNPVTGCSVPNRLRTQRRRLT